MRQLLTLEKYSVGMGDRFAHQARPQLRACLMAVQQGADVIPVWNKSNREHLTIGSQPETARAAADAAVKALRWDKPYHVDADHIRRETVDRFVPHADFYTIDVADWIGKPADEQALKRFIERHGELVGRLVVPGLDQAFQTSQSQIESIARSYLAAVHEAGETYRHIAREKGEGNFVTEISMDETDNPQTPVELLVILAAIADEGIPIQTIAPKFTGRFNKGVDYVGDAAQFEKEFLADLAVIQFAVRQYGLPPTLKLSIHSGSDKFSIYGPMRRGLERFGAGLHLKTAGTTWLEELIGLAEGDGDGRGLIIAKEIYAKALMQMDELCAPYTSVIDIDRSKLPSAETVNGWGPEQFVSALRHDQRNKSFNPNLRQLLHVGYKVAAKMGCRYLDALEACESSVSKNVTENLYERHLKPIFLNGASSGGRKTDNL
jgi:hypothetical protein